MENKKVYCILCGAENDPQAKFCTKCGEPMDQKDDDIIGVISGMAKDKAKEMVADKAGNALLLMVQKFVNSHFYGIVLSISFVLAATTVLGAGKSAKITEFNNSNLLYESYTEMIAADTSLMNLGINYYYGVGYDENGDIKASFVCESYGNLYDYSEYQVRIYDASGNLVADESDVDPVMWYIPIKDLNGSVEIIEPCAGYVQRTVTTFHTTGQVKSQAKYEDDVKIREEIYYESGALKEERYFSENSAGEVEFTSQIYNENGDIIEIYTELDGKPYARREIVYGDNYEHTYLYDYDDSGAEYMTSQYIQEFDENGWEIKRGWLNRDGSPNEVSYVTYYDNGNIKTSTTYSGDKLAHTSEFAEDGSRVLYRYADGVVYSITYYNADGGFIREDKVG